MTSGAPHGGDPYAPGAYPAGSYPSPPNPAPPYPSPPHPSPPHPVGPYAGSPYPPPYGGSWTTMPILSEEQLRRLPPPVPPNVYRPVRSPDQRPAVIGLATTLAVTAGMLWVSGLSLFWLISLAGAEVLQPVDEGPVFHLLDQFALRMSDGLWAPLYGLPLASVVSGFVVLARRPWARIVHSGVGAAALGWSAWWLRDSLLTWAVVAVYVVVAVGVLWTPAVGRWYAARRRATTA